MKPRLIDANKIHITVYGGRMNGKREMADAIEKAIKEAPEVEAIPIEYIESTIDRWKEIIGYEESVDALRILIDNWKIERKEG